MAVRSAVRRNVVDIAQRLIALRDESVAPERAASLLMEQRSLPEQPFGQQPLTAAFQRIVPAAPAVAEFVRAAEAAGRGDAALRFLARLDVGARRFGNGSFALIGVECVVLLVVLSIYGIFVLPTLRSYYGAVGAELPPFTQRVFSLVAPEAPWIWLAVAVLVIAVGWRFASWLPGPVAKPLDRLALALPEIGESLRRSNAVRLSGWLGFSAPDAAGQRAALAAAGSWSGGLLARLCAQLLSGIEHGRGIAACAAEHDGFDLEFRVAVALPDHAESLQALRARWNACNGSADAPKGATVALFHIVLGIVVAALVIAMYLPIFKLGALS